MESWNPGIGSVIGPTGGGGFSGLADFSGERSKMDDLGMDIGF